MDKQQEQQGQQEQQESKTYTKEDVDRKVSNFITQITELRKRAETLEAEKAERERADAEVNEKRMLENNQAKELLEKTRAESAKEVEALKAAIASLERDKKVMGIDGALISAGVQNKFARAGVVHEYLSMQEAPEIDQYIEQIKESMPDLFVSSRAGVSVKNSSVGSVAVKSAYTDEQAEAMLKSKDSAERLAARQHFAAKYGVQTR